MNFVVSSIKWTMLIAGLLTLTVLHAALEPYAAIQSLFGVSLDPSPVTELVVRNWGVKVGVVGLMLIYGAFNASVRNLVLVVTIVSKLTFIGLVLDQRAALLQAQAPLALIIDAVMVVWFSLYLVTARAAQAPAAQAAR